MNLHKCIFALFCSLGIAGSAAAQQICAADTNGNGTIDQSEIQQCQGSSTTGYLCPIAKQACTANPGPGGTTYSCPSGTNRPCVDDGSGTRYCSPYDCQDKSSITPVYNDPINQTPPQNDGSRDAAGQCLDNLRIFAGTPSRCREAGDQTIWQNCCHNNNPTINDTMGARGQPDQVTFKNQSSTFEFWSNQCDQKDQQTSLLAASGYCISVGTYCAEKWPLIGCVQTNESYCCFNSMLAKIIQQQGRAQLPEMGSFGTPDNPNCRGFSMDEFQAIDFSKVDFSAYYDQIRTDSQANVQNQAQQNVQQNVGP